MSRWSIFRLIFVSTLVVIRVGDAQIIAIKLPFSVNDNRAAAAADDDYRLELSTVIIKQLSQCQQLKVSAFIGSRRLF